MGCHGRPGRLRKKQQPLSNVRGTKAPPARYRIYLLFKGVRLRKHRETPNSFSHPTVNMLFIGWEIWGRVL